MKSLMLLLVIFSTLIFLSGCVSEEDIDSAEVVDNENSTYELVQYVEFSGLSRVNDTAVCHANLCVGRMEWGFEDRFVVGDTTSHGFVTVQWNSTTNSEIQHLDIFIFSGDYPGNYKIVARDQGKSPLTLAFTGDDLEGHLSGNQTGLGVGFSAYGPAKITPDQIVYWDAIVLSS